MSPQGRPQSWPAPPLSVGETPGTDRPGCDPARATRGNREIAKPSSVWSLRTSGEGPAWDTGQEGGGGPPARTSRPETPASCPRRISVGRAAQGSLRLCLPLPPGSPRFLHERRSPPSVPSPTAQSARSPSRVTTPASGPDPVEATGPAGRAGAGRGGPGRPPGGLRREAQQGRER